MARRTLLGAALGNWIGGQPQGNDVAGAVISGYDKDGKPIYIDPNTGDDVTDMVKKSGNGPMQKPSAMMSLFNPEGADRARAINEQYAAEPAISDQRNDLANQHAQQAVRQTIGYLTGQDPSEVDDKLVKEIQAYGGQGMTQGGVRGTYSSAQAEKANIGGGGPSARGQLEAEQTKNELSSEKTYGDVGGPMKAGMARANTAGAQNENAISDITLSPQRRQLNLSQLAAANQREPTVEAGLDQEAINRLSKATGVDPLIIEKDRADLQATSKRQPTEQELQDYELRNSLFAAKNNVPLQLGVQNNALQAQTDSAPLARQGIMNRMRQEAAASSQPPAELMNNPTLYKPTVGYEGNNPARMYQKLGTNAMFSPPSNPLYTSPMLRNMSGMSGIINPTGVSSPSQFQLPGGMTAIPAAPITNSIVPPTGLDIYQQMMRRVQQQQNGLTNQ